MSKSEDSLDAAYSVRTPEDSIRLYRRWATTYESDFADRMDWQMPRLVAEAYARLGTGGPVLDVGAGTGLLGVELARHGIGPVDGIDISPEMLTIARTKNVYRSLFVADLTGRLDIPDESYSGCTSSGTFTHGHVGPGAFDELLRIMRPGAVFAGSIHPDVYYSSGFAAAFKAYGPRISDCSLHPAQGFGPAAQGDHAQDVGMYVTFVRT